LDEVREQVESLDSTNMQISGELSEAKAQLREAEKPSYSGLGSRIEQLFRSAEEQSADLLSQSDAQAKEIVARAQENASHLADQAEKEAADVLTAARRDAAAERESAQAQASGTITAAERR